MGKMRVGSLLPPLLDAGGCPYLGDEFPERNDLPCLDLFKPTSPPTPAPKSETVRAYYERWIADQVPPLVRKAQERDYRLHIPSYVLPALGDVSLANLGTRDVLALRAELLGRGLSLKYVKNICASFRAMVREARQVDELLDRDPFLGIRWPRTVVPRPDPFTTDEMRRVLDWFARKRFGFHAGRASNGPRLHPHPPFHVFVHTLFATGMRPSEAVALRWSDVDVDAGAILVRRSRYLGEESTPNTAKAARTVQLHPETVRLLRAMQPLRITPDT